MRLVSDFVSLYCLLSFVSWTPQLMGQQVTRLSPLNINRDFITLSGFSSGGTFAQQFYISYSSLISGIAVFSHTYYRCGPVTNVQSVYDDACTTIGIRPGNQLYNPNNAIIDIQNYFRSGLIDNPNNLGNKPLYIYAGTSNYLFTADMSLRISQVFEPFINNGNQIRVIVQDANLTLPSDRVGFPACSSPPNAIAVSSCGFSGAFDSLRFLLGGDVRPASSESLATIQPLLAFDQTEFVYGVEGSGRYDMDSLGFMYIPTVCLYNKVPCLLHFYFHGCSVGREFVGADHILNSGFLEVAETNGIIMVFPQVVSSAENDIGCWDTYGFTNPLYATKRGPQVTVVRNMLARILGQQGLVSRASFGTTPIEAQIRQVINPVQQVRFGFQSQVPLVSQDIESDISNSRGLLSTSTLSRPRNFQEFNIGNNIAPEFLGLKFQSNTGLF